ncbi:MAG: hypothetical protein ISS33_01255 [Candidatus Omnitrophica bacterium]|nr:hypothetical protein [Candidatus Omnitrophota bacterium]
MKKKYLQACSFGGSIYGKEKSSGKKKRGTRASSKNDLVDSYSKFYKRQRGMMSSFFKP